MAALFLAESLWLSLGQEPAGCFVKADKRIVEVKNNTIK